jgi:hypothetical protein
MYAKAKVSIERYGVHACMISRDREDVNAPASPEKRSFFGLLPKRMKNHRF